MRTTSAALVAASALALTLASAKQSPEQAVNEGVKYFADRCADQQGLLKDLDKALASGDLVASKTAYIASRPPYEEIEVLATGKMIGELDGKIDSRPYALDGGEDDDEWQGFHRVERDLYRDEDTKAAKESLKALIGSVDKLCEVLDDGGDIKPQQSLDGQLALAYELAAKKYSSEEETWSDASLMIFRHNWIGIYSQFEPFKETGLDKAVAKKVDAAYKNVQAVYNTVDPNGFDAKNGVSRSYADVSIAERKRLVIDAGYDFAEALREAHTALSGDGGDDKDEEEDDGVIAEGAYPDETAAGIASLAERCASQKVTLDKLVKAVKTGVLDEAKANYAAARVDYEQIEVVASAFVDEDMSIDARPDAYEFGEMTEGWRGMHLVERQFYRDNDLEGAEKALGDVKKAVDTLCEKLADSKLYGADTAIKGVLALSLEVPAKKISSEEETVSDLSLMIFRENSKGIKAVYEPFAPLLTNETQDRMNSALTSIRSYWESELDFGNDWDTGTNFKRYSTIDIPQRKGIHARFMELNRALRVVQGELAEKSPAKKKSSDDEEDDDVCFPALAKVELASGQVVSMEDLAVGNVVRVGEGFSTVFMFTHKMADVAHDFVSISTAGGNLDLTRGHYLYVNGAMAAAKSVAVGDRITLASGEYATVTSVTSIARRGLYNPQTLSGDIVVDGFVASTYTTAVDPSFAHAVLAPFRALSGLGFTMSALESGGGALGGVAPRGTCVA